MLHVHVAGPCAWTVYSLSFVYVYHNVLPLVAPSCTQGVAAHGVRLVQWSSSAPPITVTRVLFWARTWAVFDWSQSDSNGFSTDSPLFLPPQKSTFSPKSVSSSVLIFVSGEPFTFTFTNISNHLNLLILLTFKFSPVLFVTKIRSNLFIQYIFIVCR